MKPMGVTEVKIKGEEQHLVLSREALEHALKEGTVEALYKFGVYERAPVPSGNRIEFQGEFLKPGRPVAQSIISSIEVDRDGDVVVSSGMAITENFMKNPVVLPSHMHSFPVGFDEEMVRTDSLVWAKWQWTSDLPDTQGAIYQRLWEAHALNCTSIGFIITEWSAPDDIPGWKFIEWEILEHSPVVIPANREAMRTDGIKAFLKGYAEAVMEGPSPFVKHAVDENLDLFLPKQVAVSKGKVSDPLVESRAEGVKIEKDLLKEAVENLDGPIKPIPTGKIVSNTSEEVGKVHVTLQVDADQIAGELERAKTLSATQGDGEEAASDAVIQVSLLFEDEEATDSDDTKEPTVESLRAELACALGVRGQDASEEAYTIAAAAIIELGMTDGLMKEIPEWKDYSPEELFTLFPEQYAELMANEDWTENLDHLCSAWSAGTLSKREFVFLVRLLVTSSIEDVRQQAEELEDVVLILASHIVVHQ